MKKFLLSSLVVSSIALAGTNNNPADTQTDEDKGVGSVGWGIIANLITEPIREGIEAAPKVIKHYSGIRGERMEYRCEQADDRGEGNAHGCNR